MHNWDKLIQFAVDRLEYTVGGKQKDILESDKQLKVVRAARRTGKSFDAALITYALLCYSVAVSKALNILYAGPRAEDTKHIWGHLNKMLTKAPITGLEVEFTNYKSQSTNKKKMVFNNGTYIKTATCDDVEMHDIRGDCYDFLSVDEYGNIPHKAAFMDAASQALKDKDRLNMMLIIGTPDLDMGTEFDTLMERGKDPDAKIKSWHLTEDDCPFLDEESAEVMNSLLDEDGRLREVYGEQVVRGGRLFPEFKYKEQVVPLSYDSSKPYGLGIDFGRVKPIVEFIQPMDDGTFNIFHELSPKNILIDDLIKEIKLVVETTCQNNKPIMIGVDKAGKARSDLVSYTVFERLYKEFPQTKCTAHSQLVSKDNQVHLLRKLTMLKNIRIDPSCKALATSFIKATPNKSGQILKSGWLKAEGIDDPLDALMYFIINYNPSLIIEVKKETIVDDNELARKMSEFFGG